MALSELYADAFTDTNGTLLPNHTPTDGRAWGWIKPSWETDDADIQSNEASGPASGNARVLTDDSATPDDQYSEVDVVWQANDTGFTGPLVRTATSASDGYSVIYDQAVEEWKLARVDSGSDTYIGSWAPATAPTAGEVRTVRVEAEGSELRVYIDGTLRITTTDATYASGRVGLRIGNTGEPNPTADNFSGGALVIDNARLADMGFCRGRLPFGPGRLPVPDGTID